MALRQLGYENRAFRRNPAAAFFTLFFPITFLIILNIFFGNDELSLAGGQAKQSTFYVPAIAAFSLVNACFTGLAMQTSIARDRGLLKRIGGTPLPKLSYLLGKVLHMVVVALALVIVVTVFGALFYDVELPGRTLPAFLVSIAIGAATFSALGLAVVAFIPSSDAAAPIVNGIVLPLLFVSDVFVPIESDTPGWVRWSGDLFPIKHLSAALQTSFNPFSSGGGWEPGHLLVLALWGVAGTVVALRFFHWEPRR